MSDPFGNHIVGFLMTRLRISESGSTYPDLQVNQQCSIYSILRNFCDTHLLTNPGASIKSDKTCFLNIQKQMKTRCAKMRRWIVSASLQHEHEAKSLFLKMFAVNILTFRNFRFFFCWISRKRLQIFSWYFIFEYILMIYEWTMKIVKLRNFIFTPYFLQLFRKF